MSTITHAIVTRHRAKRVKELEAEIEAARVYLAALRGEGAIAAAAASYAQACAHLRGYREAMSEVEDMLAGAP